MADYLKIPEVARRLDVSEKTARRYVKEGVLPSVFVGGAYRVSETDLEGYFRGAKVQPKHSAPKAPAPQPSLEDAALSEALQEAFAVLFRGLARRGRRIVEQSVREGASEQLSENLAEYHAEAAALARIKGRRDIHGRDSEELAEAEEAYQEVESRIEGLLEQDVLGTQDERAERLRFRPSNPTRLNEHEVDAG